MMLMMMMTDGGWGRGWWWWWWVKTLFMVTGALVFATGALVLQDMICMSQARIEKYKLYPLHRGGMKAKGKRINGDRWTQWKWLIGDSLLLANLQSHASLPKLPPPILATAHAPNASNQRHQSLVLPIIQITATTCNITWDASFDKHTGCWPTCKHCGQLTLSFEWTWKCPLDAAPPQSCRSYRGRAAYYKRNNYWGQKGRIAIVSQNKSTKLD